MEAGAGAGACFKGCGFGELKVYPLDVFFFNKGECRLKFCYCCHSGIKLFLLHGGEQDGKLINKKS